MSDPPGQERIGLRRVGRQGLWYAGATVLTRAVSFIMLPVYTRYLTPADYGIIQLIELTFDVLSIIAGSRLAMGVFTFYHKAESEGDRRAMLASAFALTAGLALAVGAAAFLLSPVLNRVVFGPVNHVPLFRLYAVAFALGLSTTVSWAWLRLAERPRAVVGYSLLKTLIQVTANVVGLAGFGLGITSMVLGSVLSSIVVAVPLWALLLRRAGLAPTRAWIRRHLRFSLPLVATQVATFTLTFGDRYFLKAYASDAVVGLYSLSYQFGFLLQSLGYAPFSSVWDPVRFAIAKQGNRDELFARAFLYLNLLLVTMATGMSLFVSDALRVMTTPAFHDAADIVPVILLAYLFQAWNGMQDIGIHISERTRYIAIANWVSGVVIIAAYFLLIPRFQAAGAAFATLVSFALRWGLTYRFSQRLWPVRYWWGPVQRLLAYSAVVVGASWLLPPLPLSLSLGAGGLLFLAYLGLVWVGGVLDADDRTLLQAHPLRLIDAVRRRVTTK